MDAADAAHGLRADPELGPPVGDARAPWQRAPVDEHKPLAAPGPAPAFDVAIGVVDDSGLVHAAQALAHQLDAPGPNRAQAPVEARIGELQQALVGTVAGPPVEVRLAAHSPRKAARGHVPA